MILTGQLCLINKNEVQDVRKPQTMIHNDCGSVLIICIEDSNSPYMIYLYLATIPLTRSQRDPGLEIEMLVENWKTELISFPGLYLY